MTEKSAILGDWGTSHLRLWLCQGSTILSRRDGPGIGALASSPRETFLNLIADWRYHRPACILLCGMVGSRNGWAETPYAACPTAPAVLREQLAVVEADGLMVKIVPGLSCRTALGGPDVLRGEETQIIGALKIDPSLTGARRLLVLPGTHTKWVVVENGVIDHFHTAPTGELFNLLKKHSMLAQVLADDVVGSSDGYALGIGRLRELGAARLSHLIFETRSRQLVDGASKADALGFLSGLLVAADVEAATSWFGELGLVTIVGDPKLGDLYAQAIAAFGGSSAALDGDTAVLAGLRALLD